MKRKLIRKFVSAGVMSVCLMAMLAACSSPDAEKTAVQSSEIAETVEETVEPTEEVQQPEAETEVEVEPTEEVVTEEPVEETTSEEPKTEMVDFETWAKQEGNDEVCLVVWNETTGTQKIIEPVTTGPEQAYIVEEGDRFAIPYREGKNTSVFVADELIYWSNSSYMELEIPNEELVQVDVISYPDGETAETKIYLFVN